MIFILPIIKKSSAQVSAQIVDGCRQSEQTWRNQGESFEETNVTSIKQFLLMLFDVRFSILFL